MAYSENPGAKGGKRGQRAPLTKCALQYQNSNRRRLGQNRVLRTPLMGVLGTISPTRDSNIGNRTENRYLYTMDLGRRTRVNFTETRRDTLSPQHTICGQAHCSTTASTDTARRCFKRANASSTLPSISQLQFSLLAQQLYSTFSDYPPSGQCLRAERKGKASVKTGKRIHTSWTPYCGYALLGSPPTRFDYFRAKY